MARFLYCTAPDGTVLRRRTENDYSFAVVISYTDRWGNTVYEAPNWSASKARAEIAARRYSRSCVVPVRTSKEVEVDERKAWRERVWPIADAPHSFESDLKFES